MYHARVTVVILALLSIGAVAAQQSVFIYHGFLTANKYEEYQEGDREPYLMGVIDGFLAAPAFGAPKKQMAWLESCTQNMPSTQIAAIVDKFLREHPERWKEGMNVLVQAAMWDACHRR